jgi:hypothetical protein
MFKLYGMNKGGSFYRILFFLFVSVSISGLAQSSTVNYWNALADVTFVNKQVDGYEIELPKFGSKAIALQGKKISVKGYLIPLSESGDNGKYMFSSLPFNSCFFCGSAGPETVIELMPKQKIKFNDNAIVVEGILILNDKDIEHHMYMLKDAIVKN